MTKKSPNCRSDDEPHRAIDADLECTALVHAVDRPGARGVTDLCLTAASGYATPHRNRLVPEEIGLAYPGCSPCAGYERWSCCSCTTACPRPRRISHRLTGKAAAPAISKENTRLPQKSNSSSPASIAS